MNIETIQAAELELIIRLQQFPAPPWLMHGFSLLGSSRFLMAIIGVIYLCWNPRLGMRLALACLGIEFVTACAKLALHQPRPFWVDLRIHGFEPDLAGFGMPSGHAAAGTALWLLAAWLFRRRWFSAAALTAILLNATSRVWLGSHFISDVLAGMVVGSVFVVWFVWREPACASKWAEWNDTRRSRVVLALSLAGLCLGWALGFLVPPTSADAAGDRFVGVAGGLRSISSTTGALLGIGLGLARAARAPKFDASGSLWQKAIRLAILGVPAVIYWFRPRGLFKLLPDLVGCGLLFIAIAFAAWAMIFALPQFLLRIESRLVRR